MKQASAGVAGISRCGRHQQVAIEATDWLFRCLVSAPDSRNLRLHLEHSKGRSSVCLRSCLTRDPLVLKLNVHMGYLQTNGRSSLWTDWWAFRVWCYSKPTGDLLEARPLTVKIIIVHHSQSWTPSYRSHMLKVWIPPHCLSHQQRTSYKPSAQHDLLRLKQLVEDVYGELLLIRCLTFEWNNTIGRREMLDIRRRWINDKQVNMWGSRWVHHPQGIGVGHTNQARCI